MAKQNANPVATDVADTATSTQADANAVPTPENTPVPGGGSWSWDPSIPGWAPNAPYAPPAA